MKLNGSLELLVYADVLNLLGNYINSIKRNTATIVDASKEVNTENTKYEFILHRGQNHNIKKMLRVQVFGNRTNKSKCRP